MMDKTSSSTDQNTTSSSISSRNQTDHLLKQVNKTSHKISKPNHHLNKQTSQSSSQHNNNNINNQQQQQQQQPPVYNINKNDFRDVVQKLTGSPAHDRLSTPPPIHSPKPPSSRLQRIRPPPLAHVSNRPPPPIADAGSGAGTSGMYGGRPRSPFSPLPPLPTVSAAAESPISAYMRFLRNSIPVPGDPDPRRMPGLSPRGNANPTSLPPVPIPSQPPAMNSFSAASSQLTMPGSPLAFGHIPSPRFQYPLLPPTFLFSPPSQLGFPQLPVSPRLPVPSPTWKDL